MNSLSNFKKEYIREGPETRRRSIAMTPARTVTVTVLTIHLPTYTALTYMETTFTLGSYNECAALISLYLTLETFGT